MPIKFCPRCGSMMRLVKEGGKAVWKCPKCGYVEGSYTATPIVERRKVGHTPDERPIVVKEDNRPKVKGVICPRCGNDEAYVFVQQTRAADEPPTRFYTCTRCGYTWREYA